MFFTNLQGMLDEGFILLKKEMDRINRSLWSNLLNKKTILDRYESKKRMKSLTLSKKKKKEEEEANHSESSHVIENLIINFKLLELLCEGHNLKMQHLVREQ